MSDQDLPVTQQDNFVADFHGGEMDLTVLKDKWFTVAVNQGDRNGLKYMCSTIKGPFDFLEMVEAVGSFHANNMMHLKVIQLTKDFNEQTKMLDSGTVDYIEAHYQDIVMESMLDASINIEKKLVPGYLTEQVKEDERASENV